MLVERAQHQSLAAAAGWEMLLFTATDATSAAAAAALPRLCGRTAHTTITVTTELVTKWIQIKTPIKLRALYANSMCVHTAISLAALDSWTDI